MSFMNLRISGGTNIKAIENTDIVM